MQNKEKILLVVNTEWGLLVALLYYLSRKEEQYYPYFILLKNSEERFNGLNLKYLPGKYKIVDDELNRSIRTPNKKFLDILNEDNIKEIVFQNPLNFITNIIVNYYQSKDSSVYLTVLSDGLLLVSPISTKNILLLNMKLLYRKVINRFKYLPLFVQQYKSIIPKVDLLISDEHISTKKFLDLTTLFTSVGHNRLIINNVFSVNMQKFEQTDIIFFTQPILSVNVPNSVKDKYLYFLKYISDYAMENHINIIIKVHPSENYNDYLKYQNNYVFIDENKNIPAEMIFNTFSGKIILSMFSSLSMHKFEDGNQHYWLYKLIDYSFKGSQSFNHLSTINNFSELEREILYTMEHKKEIGSNNV